MGPSIATTYHYDDNRLCPASQTDPPRGDHFSLTRAYGLSVKHEPATSQTRRSASASDTKQLAVATAPRGDCRRHPRPGTRAGGSAVRADRDSNSCVTDADPRGRACDLDIVRNTNLDEHASIWGDGDANAPRFEHKYKYFDCDVDPVCPAANGHWFDIRAGG